MDSVENGYRLCILGDLKRCIENTTRAGTTVAFGVSGKNDIGRRVAEFCAERGWCSFLLYF